MQVIVPVRAVMGRLRDDYLGSRIVVQGSLTLYVTLGLLEVSWGIWPQPQVLNLKIIIIHPMDPELHSFIIVSAPLLLRTAC